MAQPEDQIAIILEELRQDLTNTLTMLTIVIALRRNSAHLLQLLRHVGRALRAYRAGIAHLAARGG